MASWSPVRRPALIVTRTPMRVSFAGGGTDLPAFYERGYGAVLSSAIDKYIWVTVKRHSEVFDEPVRVNYSLTEQVDTVDQLKNDITRACLQFLEIDPPIYISTVGDLPASTGLGSSSAFAVGLLNALHRYRGDRVSAGQLAEEACHIEIDVLGQPIGRQDQYAAAFGGLNLFTFRPGGSVTVEPQSLPVRVLAELFESMMLFWTGHQRDSSSVLTEQQKNVGEHVDDLSAIRDQAFELQTILRASPTARDIGQLVHRGWLLKRGLASSVTNPQIDAWYERAMSGGACGGKIAGAGNGGFLLMIAEPDSRAAVRQALSELTEVDVRPEVHGSQILLPLSD
jgi:D-glycero-alpha-D-manno-heptose-7-phosphate kinase